VVVLIGVLVGGLISVICYQLGYDNGKRDALLIFSSMIFKKGLGEEREDNEIIEDKVIN